MKSQTSSKSFPLFYQCLAVFLALFMSFNYPLAILASTVAGTDGTGLTTTSTSTLSTNTTSLSTAKSVISGIPDNFTFTMDMYKGVRNEQVRMLQTLLNADSRTVVTSTGAGSAGNETVYFGNATEDAVIRFQEIYKKIILVPIGDDNPTGIIGSRSRSVLNQILANLKNNRPAELNLSIDGIFLIDTITTTTATSTSATSTATTTSTNSSNKDIPTINTAEALPDATNNLFYATSINGSGGAVSYSWNITSGSLPPGITMVNPGVACYGSPCYYPMTIAGIPKSTGFYTFTAIVHSGTQSQTKNFSIRVLPGSTNTNTSNTTNTNTSTTNTSNTTTSSTNSSSTKSNTTGALIAVGAVVAVAGIASALSSSASSAGVSTVFGGRITYVQYCTCTSFILLFIYDNDLKSVIQLLYVPGLSRLYEEYNVFEAGPQVLGGYTMGSTPCMVYAGEDCVQFGSPTGIIDTLRGVGTTAT